MLCRKNARAEAIQYTAAEKEAEKLSKRAEQAMNVTKDLVCLSSGWRLLPYKLMIGCWKQCTMPPTNHCQQVTKSHANFQFWLAFPFKCTCRLSEWHFLQKSEVKSTETKLTGAKGDAENVAKAKDSAETKLSKISSELDGTASLSQLHLEQAFMDVSLFPVHADFRVWQIFQNILLASLPCIKLQSNR